MKKISFYKSYFNTYNINNKEAQTRRFLTGSFIEIEALWLVAPPADHCCHDQSIPGVFSQKAQE